MSGGAGAMGSKWEAVRMDWITMRPRSQTEQLGPDGVGHGGFGGFEHVQDMRWGHM